MGQKTRTEIITAGLQLANNTTLSTLAIGWLNDFLRGVYAEGEWLFLKKSIPSLSLPAGTAALSLGAGSGGVTNEIRLIKDEITVYTSDYTYEAVAYVKPLYGSPDNRSKNTATWRGAPTGFKVRPGSLYGNWSLEPMPIPDKAYLLALDYIEQPANLTSDSQVPIYPNDETMVYAVMARALLHQRGASHPHYQAASDDVAGRVSRDKSKYMSVPGINDVMPLDPATFGHQS